MTLDEIAKQVREDQGVMSVRMDIIRDAYRAGRLRVHVRTNLSRELSQRGIDHCPADLPDRQDADVRLFVRGTPAADLIQAATTPGTPGDQVLRARLDGGADTKLLRIREILE